MQRYYDKVLEYLGTGNHEDAIRYFEQWKVAGLLDQEEIEGLNKILPQWSQVVKQEALSRLLVEKENFTQEEFLRMVEVIDREMRTKIRWKHRKEFWIKG
jgi:hypothetical protein